MADGIIIRCRYENALDSEVGSGLHILQLVSMPGYDSWTLKYAHLREVFVKPGQKVERYTVIAESGRTGAVFSPYLHIDLMDLHHQWRPIPIQSE